MVAFSRLAPDLKMCVRIYQERVKGKEVWFSRLVELLKGDVSKLEISKNEDRLMDIGILDKEYKKVESLWTSCYVIDEMAESFVENVVENLIEVE